jgi:hypothetical protein
MRFCGRNAPQLQRRLLPERRWPQQPHSLRRWAGIVLAGQFLFVSLCFVRGSLIYFF